MAYQRRAFTGACISGTLARCRIFADKKAKFILIFQFQRSRHDYTVCQSVVQDMLLMNSHKPQQHVLAFGTQKAFWRITFDDCNYGYNGGSSSRFNHSI